ncbi:MAG: hypothetical protein F4160_13185 [Rhodospirillaceae bacterium]|nr:hypothetical protein [Rhodospirillaceae bacterium]MYH37736.1 hypothetical protein [Rhodospirillaceae bacterium]MYK13601.1 hypothetical protein [Rhodospirillaceae bacterium]
MIRHLHSVRGVAQEISDAADGALEAYRNGRVEEEPQITDRIIGAIENRVGPDSRLAGDSNPRSALPHEPVLVAGAGIGQTRDRYPGRIVWNARSLRTSSGRSAEEKRHGADLMGVLDIDIPDYQIKKGFLAQAKRAEPGRIISNREWGRLHDQCEIMLSRTPDSFVWIYSKEKGIRIFSAISVVNLDSRYIFDLYDRSVSSFFEYHLECFIGDHRLNSTKIETLDALAELPVERVLKLSARYSE